MNKNIHKDSRKMTVVTVIALKVSAIIDMFAVKIIKEIIINSLRFVNILTLKAIRLREKIQKINCMNQTAYTLFEKYLQLPRIRG